MKKRDTSMKFLDLICMTLVIALLAQMPLVNAAEDIEYQSGIATCLGMDLDEKIEAIAYLEAIRTTSLPPAWTPDTSEGLCSQKSNLVQDGAISF